MISLALLQFCIMIVCVHACKSTYLSIKDKLIALFNRKKSDHHFYDIALLDIPEHTYNYSEYQDGLVSDDFNNCK